ncbi:hypothetical protein CW705_02830 [Candidatus Bathyarchaeota archaeon]|nr:MAG: hypothetical protein CW705_02830 [Candidatus Bathyarchaeota archaeon]
MQKLDYESIRYPLLHELIHYELKSTNHNGNFQKTTKQQDGRSENPKNRKQNHKKPTRTK